MYGVVNCAVNEMVQGGHADEMWHNIPLAKRKIALLLSDWNSGSMESRGRDSQKTSQNVIPVTFKNTRHNW